MHNIDDAPELIGDRVRLRGMRESDIARRASLGQIREIVRGFGGDLEHDQPMSEKEAARSINRRFGSGPHWVIADQANAFVGILRLAPIDLANRSANFAIGIFDHSQLGRGVGTQATMLALA